MLTDLLRKLDQNVDLEEEELIYEQIRSLATADPEPFILEVKAIPLADWHSLEEVYEALSYEPAPWVSFYLDEVDRLLDLARSSSNPGAVLAPLNAFYLLSLDDEELPMQKALAKKFYDHLDDDNHLIRRKCVILLADFTGPKDFATLNKLEQMAGEDSDWRLRYYALEALEEISPERAERVSLPLSIRLKVRVTNMNYE